MRTCREYMVDFSMLDTLSGDDFRDIVQAITIYMNAMERTGMYPDMDRILAMIGISKSEVE